MMKVWAKIAGVMLAGAVMVNGAAPAAMAAEVGTAPARQEQHAPFRKLREELKEVQGKIKAEREQLQRQKAIIKALVEELKQDEDKHRLALEKAKVELRQLRLMADSRHEINDRIKALAQELKAAVEARDADAAARVAGNLLSVMHTKLSMMRDTGSQADKVITLLRAALNGQGE